MLFEDLTSAVRTLCRSLQKVISNRGLAGASRKKHGEEFDRSIRRWPHRTARLRSLRPGTSWSGRFPRKTQFSCAYLPCTFGSFSDILAPMTKRLHIRDPLQIVTVTSVVAISTPARLSLLSLSSRSRLSY